MRVTLLTVVVALSALTIHLGAAADPECIYRQIRSLPTHWANPIDCSRFYRCTNKNVKREVVCTGDKEYNPKTGKCASGGKGYCKLSLAAPVASDDNPCANEVTGAYVAQDGKCRNFYICNDNLAYPQSCDSGSLFNTTLATCVPDTETECWQNFCLNQPDGAYLPDPIKCQSFYICNANEAVSQSCDSGSYFNTNTGNCQPDTDNANCWENFCLTSDNGAMVKNPQDCHAFYVCNDKIATPQQCPDGSYFDWQSNNCQPGECPDDETTTTPDCTDPPTSPTPPPCIDCTCPGGYTEGQFLPYPGNCAYFYICSCGVLIKESCQDGNYFNETLETCMPDTEGVCPQCSRNYRRARRSLNDEDHDIEDAEDTLSIEKMGVEHVASSGESPSLTEPQPTCLGRYFEGELIPHDECDKFLVCFESNLIPHECGKGNYFNKDSSSCMVDEQGSCKPQNKQFQDAVSANSPTSCSGQDPTACTCPGGYEPGQIVPHPTDCDKYYVCENGQLIIQECGEGNMFSSCDGACIPDTEHTCWPQQPGCDVPSPSPSPNPDMCIGQPNGVLLPNSYQCEAFYQCVNGQPVPETCTSGQWFNPTTKICEPDLNAICITPCANETGIVFLPHPNCKMFYFCNNGQTHVETCTEGGFNVDYGVCTLNATCEESLCQNQNDGTTFPVAGDKTKFYVCMSGLATIRDCEPNTAYNELYKACLTSPSENCNQTVCEASGFLGAFPTLNGIENAFCFCRQGAAYESNCPEDYVFNTALGICYSNAPCDPEICQSSPEYTVSVNRNDTQSFCLCVNTVQVIIDCPNDGTFYPNIMLCRSQTTQDPNCNPTFCLSQPDYTTSPAETTNAGFCLCKGGSSIYTDCGRGYSFNTAWGICLPSSAEYLCDFNKCANGVNEVFPTLNDPSSFCYCLNSTTAGLRECPKGFTFSPVQLVCLPQYCDSTTCLSPAYKGEPFPAVDYPYGFCLCNNTVAELHNCEQDFIFDTTHLVCVPEANLECDITLCQVPGKPYPYDIPANDDPYSFCYCINNNTVQLFHCPLGKIYSPENGFCINETQQPTDCDSCTCPGGYAAGTLLPHPQYCSQYYICSGGALQLQNCGTGNFFNVSVGVCQPNTDGACTDNPSPCTCVGSYREGEMIANPTNRNMYYRCLNAQLHQEYCNTGYYFDSQQSTCVPEGNSNRYYRPRSLVTKEVRSDDEDFLCHHNTKRSVPSNCSQYEICQNTQWRRRTCPENRYYNPEEQRCLEPRDDTVCNYAKVSGLPECNDLTEQQTLPHKYGSKCGLYYRCARGKWRLKSCGKHEYYSRLLRTCLTTTMENICEARNVSETEDQATANGEIFTSNCRHTAVRPLTANCAKYLMCLEGEWWQQFCPLGMFFNTSLNYCVPDEDGNCALLDTNEKLLAQAFDLNDESCTRDGDLRPSTLACNRYYICLGGLWRQQSCGKTGLYYNATAESCMPDIEGVCKQSDSICSQGERREFPLNCRAFEVCENGEWQHRSCEGDLVYDVLLKQCIPNTDGSCATNGLRKSCRNGDLRTLPAEENCTQFLYCETDNWLLGSCLKGHTYLANLRTCVPHLTNERCKPMINVTNLTSFKVGIENENIEDKDVDISSLDTENSCLERDDGTSVPHPSDCTRFFMCLHEMLYSEQQCSSGSFFDPKLGYCRPNDGSCIIPLSGPCENATDGDLLPHLEDCRAYYKCSTLNGTQILYCPNGEYYHSQTQNCRIDQGECRQQSPHQKCADPNEHGKRFPHERYCNIYYACVRGIAVPVECPDGHQFNPVLGRCLKDDEQQCLNGELINGNETSFSCGNLTDGTYLPNHSDCTRYFICSNGHAQPKRCRADSYFDSQQLLCVPDDGSCPFIDNDEKLKPNKPTPPDPIFCEGKHGNLLPDPNNCNEFYVCINGKLRHERCYTDHFFNQTTYQCQPYDDDNGNGGSLTTTETNTAAELTESMSTIVSPKIVGTQQKCTDKPTNFTDLCSQIPEGTSIAEQGDCRRFISCQDNEPLSQRCRNGESYDSLLGFCRQNDGTCLLENGQRVGECNRRHGQLARDNENCRSYFVCINGQKISGECAENEFFDKATNMCQNDVLMQCSILPKKATSDVGAINCKSLSEGILYPYVYDNCRSYFQCVNGAPKVHQCVDGLYFDASTTRCVKEIHECSMTTTSTTQSLLRAPEVNANTSPKNRCEGIPIGLPYANLEDHCRSYYVCEGPDSVVYTTCPGGTLYSTEKRACAIAKHVICHI